MAAVGAGEEERRVEGGELGGEEVGCGGVEGVFRAGVQVEVPDLEEARGVVGGGGVFGVGGEEEFGELYIISSPFRSWYG